MGSNGEYLYLDHNGNDIAIDWSSRKLHNAVVHNEITFHINGGVILRFCENGDIYVREKLVKNDIDVVIGMREFLASQGCINEDLRYHIKQAADEGSI